MRVYRALIFICVLMILSLPAQAIDEEDTLLVWLADGLRPGELASNSERGSLALMNGAGEISETILELPANAVNVAACTEQATAPDGSAFAYYVGNDTSGSVYVINAAGEAAQIRNVGRRSCLGLGTLQWTDDSGTLALLNADAIANTEMIQGTLALHPADALDEASFERDNVAAFKLNDDNVAFIEVFNDYVSIYEGAPDDLTEVTRLYSARENCGFRASDIAYVNDGTLAVILGQNCTGSNTWDLYRVDIASRSANRLLREDTRAGFFSQAAAMHIISAGGNTVYAGTPDGLLGNFSAELRRIDMANPIVDDPVFDFIVTPRQPAGTFSTAPRFSPDGRYIAIIRQTADVQSTLVIIDLRTTDTVTEVSGGSAGSTISAMAFDSSNSLYYLVGGVDGADNLLRNVDLSSGDDTDIVRGNFIPPLVLNADASEAVLLNRDLTGADDDPFFDLVAASLSDGSLSTIYSGAELDDSDEITTLRFASPLWWLP
jgi:hypothetical protein